MSWLNARTADLLARPYHRRSVELIAAELLACKVLTGRRARHLLHQARHEVIEGKAASGHTDSLGGGVWFGARIESRRD
jgi:hypothetical protein